MVSLLANGTTYVYLPVCVHCARVYTFKHVRTLVCSSGMVLLSHPAAPIRKATSRELQRQDEQEDAQDSQPSIVDVILDVLRDAALDDALPAELAQLHPVSGASDCAE